MPIISHCQHIMSCQNKMLSQSHRNMPNHLFPFPHWFFSILTIPSVTLLRKNLEGECKSRKRSEAKIINVYQLVSHVTYWSTLTNASLLKIAIKHIGTLCFCILFTKFAYRMPNFIQNDSKQWTIRIITASKQY